MHSSDEEDIVLTPEFMKERAADIVENLLPNKSRLVYIKTYDEFCKWKNENQASGTFSESVFLTYFNELSKKRKSSTLWSIYSMLRCTVKTRHNIDIKTYSNLQAYLKRLSEGYKPNKSPVFTAPNVERFLNEAPDSQFLAVKVSNLQQILLNTSIGILEQFNCKPININFVTVFILLFAGCVNSRH